MTDTDRVPLVLLAIVDVARLQLYCEPESQALSHAAKAGGNESRKAAMTAAMTKFRFFIFVPLLF